MERRRCGQYVSRRLLSSSMSGEESPLPFTIRDLPEHAISRRRPGVPLHLCRSANTIFFLKKDVAKTPSRRAASRFHSASVNSSRLLTKSDAEEVEAVAVSGKANAAQHERRNGGDEVVVLVTATGM